MKIRILLLTLLTLGIGFFSYKVTHALFSNTAASQNNTFAASEIFPTATPSATPTLTLTPTPTGTPSAQLGDVVINEIMWMGSSESTADEWIELRNMTSNTIDISSWMAKGLGSGSASITINPNKSIPPNGFFLISNFPSTSANSILDADPDQTTASVSLDNDGEQLILKDSGGNIIDTANGVGGWFAGSNVNPRASMARKDPPGDGTVADNWFTSSISANLDPTASESATPKAANSL